MGYSLTLMFLESGLCVGDLMMRVASKRWFCRPIRDSLHLRRREPCGVRRTRAGVAAGQFTDHGWDSFEVKEQEVRHLRRVF